MAAQQLAHWLAPKMKKALKNDIARNSRHEERMLFAKIKNGSLNPDEIVFTPYRHNKNDAYYD